MIKFLDLKKQYAQIKPEVDAAIAKVVQEASFIGGLEVANFEKQFAAYQQAEHCVGVGNGTDALEIALSALDLPRGSEVLVPANSFIASSEAVTAAGLRVVFCDIDPLNYTVSIEDARRCITTKTKAIIAVHLYGHPCDMRSILDLASEYDLKVVEDCAQAHGAEFNGVRIGALGDIGAFSFYPGKNLGAYGDGGALVTNDAALAKRCRMLANHGRVDKYDHQFEGRNSRLDALQAAVLNVKLPYLDRWTQRRIDVAEMYLSGLSGIKNLILPVRASWAKQVYHLFVVRTACRDELRSYLKEHGIETGVHYPVALPKLQAYEYLGQDVNHFQACKQDSELLSLPMGEHLEDIEVKAVIETVHEFFRLKT